MFLNRIRLTDNLSQDNIKNYGKSFLDKLYFGLFHRHNSLQSTKREQFVYDMSWICQDLEIVCCKIVCCNKLKVISKAQDLLLVENLAIKYFIFSVKHSADKFSNEQQIFELSYCRFQDGAPPPSEDRRPPNYWRFNCR